MAASLHWTEMAPLGMAGAVLGAALLLVGAAVVGSGGEPVGVVAAVLETSGTAQVAELPDAAAVAAATAVASVDLEWSHAGLSFEGVGGVEVVSSPGKRSVSISVPSICTEKTPVVPFSPP